MTTAHSTVDDALLWLTVLRSTGDVVELRCVDLYGDYEGNGCAIATLADGRFATVSYGHCSCYGPEESMSAVAVHETMDEARRATGERDVDDLDKSGVTWMVSDNVPALKVAS